MTFGQRPSSWAGFVAESPVSLNVADRSGAHVTRALRNSAERPSADENRLWRRDRRVGLALMVGSSLISVLVLYGLWMLSRMVL
jgi:hypothetical protein